MCGHIMTSRTLWPPNSLCPACVPVPATKPSRYLLLTCRIFSGDSSRGSAHKIRQNASRICFCQEHDHGDHGGGTQYRTRGHIMTSRTLWPPNSLCPACVPDSATKPSRYLLLTCQKFFRQQLARVSTQDPAERPGSVFAKNMTMGTMGAAHNTVRAATS